MGALMKRFAIPTVTSQHAVTKLFMVGGAATNASSSPVTEMRISASVMTKNARICHHTVTRSAGFTQFVSPQLTFGGSLSLGGSTFPPVLIVTALFSPTVSLSAPIG